MNLRQLFLQHVAQTSPEPIAFHIVSAEGNYLEDATGKRYLDLIGGISVANTGHRHPDVVKAIQKQVEKYLHVMVYGELIQSPQVEYAQLLSANLPSSLDCVYFTNSGAEAVEGAMKLAKRVTGKTDIVAAHYSYHGSTMGALSVMGDEYWRNAFRPLLPGVWHGAYNTSEFLELINEQTACVLIEIVQAEAGVYKPKKEWLQAVRKKCDETETLLIIDEIQCGFGRTGTLWGFEQYEVVPDVLLLGKALGGGMPLGAFIASQKHMQTLTHDPVLGHITTFGGHPVSCAAGMASFQVLLQEKYFQQVAEKEKFFLQLLKHPAIKNVRSAGLIIAIELDKAIVATEVIEAYLKRGFFADWFLFAPQCIRFAPPLTITASEIELACTNLLEVLSEYPYKK
jgi:acetylornithine/N-succinyldiaminopimelate aminotransferase